MFFQNTINKEFLKFQISYRCSAGSFIAHILDSLFKLHKKQALIDAFKEI